MRGCFVTGTGTEVGKTVVAAAIARTHARRGEAVAVFKPAISGLEATAGEPAEPDHLLLRRAARSRQSEDEIAPYRYGPPVSPHLGAELAGEAIEPKRLVQSARAAGAGADVLVCEGVGGLLVPLTLGYLVRDLARDLALAVVIASSPWLGTINHTLLTIEAVRAVGLQVVAVVLTPWPDHPGVLESSNREAIERLGGVRVEALRRLDLAVPESWPPLEIGFFPPPAALSSP
jgi:dethiobiotin synthetase